MSNRFSPPVIKLVRNCMPKDEFLDIFLSKMDNFNQSSQLIVSLKNNK